PGRRRDVRGANQGQLSQGQVPPPQGPPRRLARSPRHRPQNPRLRLSHARQKLALSRPSAKPISTRSARPGPSPTSNAASNASATTSPLNQRPRPHDPTSTLKLFS